MSPRAVDRLVLVLGVVTIAAYGSTYYAFGVLLEPIHGDTGWARGHLGAAYSLSLLLGAVGAAAAGPVVDRWGGRAPLVGAALIGAPVLGMAAHAESPGAFIALWGGGAGIVSALATYHVTMVVLARARGRADPRAFAALTFLGGLASPIYLPVVALLVEHLGWRDAQRLIAATLAVALLVTAVLLPRPQRPARPTDAASPAPRPPTVGALRAVADAIARPSVRRFALAAALAALGGTALNAYQVPAMQGAGLTLAAASGLAALRGLASLPGRALLAVVVAKVPAGRALVGTYLTMALGTMLLLGAGTAGVAPAYAVATGIVFGSVLPLQALVAADLFDHDRLGTLMGAQQALNGIAAAAGPLVAGVVIDRTDSFAPLVAGIGALYAVAALVVNDRSTTRSSAWVSATDASPTDIHRTSSTSSSGARVDVPSTSTDIAQ